MLGNDLSRGVIIGIIIILFHKLLNFCIRSRKEVNHSMMQSGMREIKEIIKTMYEQMKGESQTYGELRKKIHHRHKEVAWGCQGVMPQAVEEELMRLYREETDGLLIDPPATD